jgi:hypothetical protein
MVVPRPLSVATYKFTRTCAFQFGYNSYAGFTSPSGALVYGNGLGLKFQLSQMVLSGTFVTVTQALPNYTEFTSLFDRWRITNVRLKFHYASNIANGSAVPGTLTGVALPILQIANDYDDAAPPASNVELLQRQNTKYWTLDSTGPKNHSIAPKVILAGENSGAFTSFVVADGHPFIDCGTPNTDHVGVKLWCETQTSAATQLQLGYIWVYAMFDLEFKDPR